MYRRKAHENKIMKETSSLSPYTPTVMLFFSPRSYDSLSRWGKFFTFISFGIALIHHHATIILSSAGHCAIYLSSSL